MGCGSSSASAPGKFNDDQDMLDDNGERILVDKKTGASKTVDGGKDDDGQENDFFEVEEAEGEQFMSVRPWLGQIAEPDNHNPVNNDKPDQTYELEYVYGYRCADSKQNVYFNRDGNAVYMTAALGVILDHGSNTQKFFGGGEVDNTAKNRAKDTDHHTDDVMCISVNEDRDTAVSGQVGASPTIFTWDACTGEKKNRMKVAKGARGITACDINAQNFVCAVDLHNDHNVMVYDNSGSLVFKDKGDQNKIHDMAWDKTPGSKRFCSAGVKHIYFWDAGKQGGDKTKGLFSGSEQTSFACATWDNNGVCYTGGSNGSVYIWGGDDGRTCQGTIKAHRGFISAITFRDGKLYTGGKDGKINVIDTSSKQIESTQEYSFVRAIDLKDGKMLVGQRDGTIVLSDGGNRTPIMSSHSDGEVWGLVQQADGTVVTSADDNKVMFWDPTSRRHLKTCKVSDRRTKAKRGGASTLSRLPDSQCSRALAVNADWIVVAGNDGAVSVRAAAAAD
jgi:microtubule-associated protein-like 6